MGDPAGVGPETIVGAWTKIQKYCRPLVLGHPEILRRAVGLWETGAQVVPIGSPEDAEPSSKIIPCLKCGADDMLEITPGTIDARAGQAVYEAIVKAARLALAGDVDAITTAPLHKESLNRAGHAYPGHTELLAELCGVDDFAMMLYLAAGESIRSPDGLAVVHVTLHTALRDVFEQLSERSILAKARLLDGFMRQIKGSRPKIGVCALNPHGGEGGLFGREELTIIGPAVQSGMAQNLDLDGPFPADTLMIDAAAGKFDAVVAMYHDQGHIALKLLGMHEAVNITLGLPIIRTSVAHGTAFDLAWQRRAEPGSMIEAVRVAALMATNKK